MGFLGLLIVSFAFEIPHRLRELRFLLSGQPHDSKIFLEMPSVALPKASLTPITVCKSKVTKWVTQGIS